MIFFSGNFKNGNLYIFYSHYTYALKYFRLFFSCQALPAHTNQKPSISKY